MSDLHVKGSGVSFAVYRGNVRVSAFFCDQDHALNRLDKMLKAERIKERKCMCCQTVFRSEGIHNRLCSTCRAQNFDPAMMQTNAVMI
jgi:hypothetical protein